MLKCVSAPLYCYHSLSQLPLARDFRCGIATALGIAASYKVIKLDLMRFAWLTSLPASCNDSDSRVSFNLGGPGYEIDAKMRCQRRCIVIDSLFTTS